MDFTNQTIKLWNMQNMDSTNPFNGGSPVASNKPVLPNRSSTANLFSDSFESEDLSASLASVNTCNFVWGSDLFVSLVKGAAGSNERVWRTATVYNDSRDWTTKDGNIAMRFNYPSGSSSAEQRMSFDAQSELWVRYWIRVPVNFAHGTLNNKFFSIWQDTYDGGGTCTWETRPNAGGCDIYYKDGGAGDSDTGRVAFIDTATDLGRWMQVVFHLKAESSAGANDGIIELYRRWDDEQSFTLIHGTSSADSQFSDGSGYRNAYLMGWANDPYASDTEWLLDKFEMSTGSLI